MSHNYVPYPCHINDIKFFATVCLLYSAWCSSGGRRNSGFSFFDSKVLYSPLVRKELCHDEVHSEDITAPYVPYSVLFLMCCKVNCEQAVEVSQRTQTALGNVIPLLCNWQLK
jgi:hypothetical protein